MAEEGAKALDDDQAAVYDRQLRVWGVEVQQKLNAARVLIVGFNKTAAEIAKNIVLAGVGQVTLAADGPASAHAGGNFLIPTATAAAAAADQQQQQRAADVAARTLQEMNPLVRVVALPGGEAAVDAAAAEAASETTPSDNDSSTDPIASHDLIVWCGPPTALGRAARCDAACRRRGKLFMAAAVSGHAGYCFCDYGAEYTYRPKENEVGGPVAAAKDAAATTAAAAPAGAPPQPPPEQTVSFSTLADALAAPLGGLHANAHPLFPVLCATAAVEKEQQDQQQPPSAAAVERALREGALGGSPGGADLLSAAVDLARAYVGQAARGDKDDDALVASVMREYAPAAATVGAVAANAALRAVSRSGAPLRNTFFYSCADGRGLVEDQPALAQGLAGAANGGGAGAAGVASQKKAGAAAAADEAMVVLD